MKYLIINADDFGYSEGINKGIIHAHSHGLVTSTSVMVDAIAAKEATTLTRLKDLSVGLHFVLADPRKIESELARQVGRFTSIVGRKPDHIDTHKSQPDSNELVRAALSEYAQAHKTPVRSLGYAKLIKSFFGFNIDGSGTLDENNISLEAFKRAVDEATDEYSEIMCHVGYSDDYLRGVSSYNDSRQKELTVLTSTEAKHYVESKGIHMCSWNLVRQKRFSLPSPPGAGYLTNTHL